MRLVVVLLLAVVAAVGGYAWMQSPGVTESDLRPSKVDIGFVSSMVVHHKQAVLMGQLMLDGRETRLRALAKNITYSQLYELGQMEGWLSLWGRPLNTAAIDMSWMLLGKTTPDNALLAYLIDCQNSPKGMAGLASLAEINALRVLDGRERDEHFMRLMMAHHEGGLPMAQFAAANAKLAVVKKLAQNVVIDQSKEINRIKITLGAIEALNSGG